MAVYSITYDLNKETDHKDRYALHKAIRGFDSWIKLCDSTYLVETSLSPAEVYDRLDPHLDDNDYAMVVRIMVPYAVRTTPDVRDWLRARVANTLEALSE